VYALGVERMSEPRQTTAAASPAAASRQLVKGQRGVVSAVWDTSTRPPTFTQPQLAVILIPKAVPGARVGGGGGMLAAPTTTADEGWVFPVSKPLAPEPGDTQALAVNTTDNTVEYEAAFAMVWVDDNVDAMNVNEAQAYASCESCAAVAVAYQVVFVIESDETDNNVAAPQNLAGALNYECVNCLTYALAQQLFITLDRPLTEDEMAALDEVWTHVQDLEARINNDQLTLEEIDMIDDELAGYTAQIKAIVAPAMATSTAPSTAVQTASQTSPPTAPSTESPTATQPSTTAAPSPSPTESPTASSTPSSSTAPTSSSSEPTSSATSPEPSTTSDPSASTDPTSAGTVDSTSDGSTSGGTAPSP
jgi:putative peptide zinc metalloprotease protein